MYLCTIILIKTRLLKYIKPINNMEKNNAIIEDAYKEYKAMLLFYVSNLINDADEACDMI